jgi:hypothetical protein
MARRRPRDVGDLLAHNVKDFAVDGSRVAMIDTTNTLFAYDGSVANAPTWSYLSHDVAKVVLTGQRVIFVGTDHHLYREEQRAGEVLHARKWRPVYGGTARH